MTLGTLVAIGTMVSRDDDGAGTRGHESDADGCRALQGMDISVSLRWWATFS